MWHLLLRINSRIERFFCKKKFQLVACDLKHLTIGPDYCRNFTIQCPEKLVIGNGSVVNGDLYIHAFGGVSIGKYCHIGKGLTIFSHNHNFRSEKLIPYDELEIIKPVYIGDAVWIGANVTVMPGTKIGDGAIIGGGSVLRGEIPSGSIVIGNPCKVVGGRDMAIFNELYKQASFY